MSRNRGSARIAAQQAEAVEPRHHHVAQQQVGTLRLRIACNAASPSGTACTSYWASQQAHDVVAHVGVVVRQQDAMPHAGGGRVGAKPCQRSTEIQDAGSSAGTVLRLRQPAQRLLDE